MILIAESVIKPNKRILYELATKIYGVKYQTILKLCKQLGLNPLGFTNIFEKNMFLKALSEKFLNNNYILGNDLREQIFFNIKRAIEINSTIGRRHVAKLPVHGQRTHTNAKTCRKQVFDFTSFS